MFRASKTSHVNDDTAKSWINTEHKRIIQQYCALQVGMETPSLAKCWELETVLQRILEVLLAQL